MTVHAAAPSHLNAPPISRRRFLSVAVSAFPLLGAVSRGPGAGKRPNILLLLTDDQRFNTLHALNNTEVRTPNMDRLLRRGTAFTHAHIMGGTTAAVCAPSRAMLLTGRTLFRVPASIVTPERVPPEDRGECPFETFPEVFRQAGYTTFGTGKWHNHPKLFAKAFTAGGAVFFGGMCDHDKVPIHDFRPDGDYAATKTHAGKGFSSELFSNEAIRFLHGRDAAEPFLMYVSYTAPHDPRMAPREYADLYPPEKVRVPPNFLPEHPFDNGELRVRDEKLLPFPRTPEAVQGEVAAYYAMITHLDAQIGRVLDALEETGHADNTIVVLAGDNGLAVGQHGLLGKQNLYEHSVRVPLVLAGPGIPKNRRRDALCYLSDLFPTLCDLTGLPVPDSVEGKSLAPVLNHRDAEVRDSVFYAYRAIQRGVRQGRWKLIRYSVGGVETIQLFDLRSDPWEMDNLAPSPEHADRVSALTALLAQWMRDLGDPCDLAKPDWGRGNA